MWVPSLGWEGPLEESTWQTTPIFLPGEAPEQRSLVGHSPKDHKESDVTEATWHKHAHMSFIDAWNPSLNQRNENFCPHRSYMCVQKGMYKAK